MPVSLQEARQWAKEHSSHLVGADDLAAAYCAGYERCEYLATHKEPEEEFPTDEQLTIIRRMYLRERRTAKEIAAEFGKTHRQITHVFEKFGIRRNVRWNKSRKKYLRSYFGKGKSTKDIANAFKTTETAVRMAYHKFKS